MKKNMMLAAVAVMVLSSAAMASIGATECLVADNLLAVTMGAVGLGDYNGDGSVDQGDYNAWADNYGGRKLPLFAEGSYIADGDIAGADFTGWADHFGEGTRIIHEPVGGDPQLKYRRTQLANGQWAYDFYLATSDGQQKSLAATLAFTGHDGAMVKQVMFSPYMEEVESQTMANIRDGKGGYSKARDTWAYSLFGSNPIPGISERTGEVFTGFHPTQYDPVPADETTAGWWEMSCGTGAGSLIGDGALVAHVVCDGQLTWTGTVSRLGLNYSARGLAGAGGDFNGDGVVDQADYTTWADHFGWTGDPANSPLVNDFNGVVDQADYTTWADTYGQGASAVTVPEPASLALLGLGAAGLLRRRRL